MADRLRVGLVGARGHTGAELLAIIARHPALELAFAGSRERAGEEVPGFEGLQFEAIGERELAARDAHAVILALPDGASEPYVGALDEKTVVVDLSADHRFDDHWVYGLTELHRDELRGARRIANPGCYATALQLAVAPLAPRASGIPVAFGVSGYSGAGSTPSPRNDVARLEDNLMPYKLVGHNHEREATRHLGMPVRFVPHVHPAFRGLLVTAHVPVSATFDAAGLEALFREAYDGEALIEVQSEVPELRDGANRSGALLGGFAVSEDGHSAVVVAAIDNLLKGAAVQAIQNLNLALGLPELAGIL